MITTNHATRRFLRPHNQRARLSLIALMLVFALSSAASPFSSPVIAVAPPTGTGLAVGAYNVLSCANGQNYKARMQTVAKNITTLGLDIVGMSEYNAKSCFGLVLKELNSLGGNWQENEQHGTDYTVNQTSVIWNAASVTKLSEEVFDMDTPSNTNLKKDAHSGCSGCDGGTRYAHIVRFQDKTGKQFTVASVHLGTGHTNAVAAHRVLEINNLMNKLRAETASVFIVGDMNASNGKSKYAGQDRPFYDAVRAAGYATAQETATQKVNATYATITPFSKSSGITIDQIFYRNTSPPSYYEAFGCNSVASCGSDHRPIKAIFDKLSGNGVGGLCNPAGGDSSKWNQYSEWNIEFFDPTVGICCASGSLATELIGGTNAEKAYNFLTTSPIATNNGKPLTQAQAAGAVGNLMRESGGDTYALDPKASNGTHFGIVQWGGSRYPDLKNFAKAEGGAWDNFEIQLKFIIEELENKESAVIKDGIFKQVPNTVAGARTAAERWDKFYERSGGAGMVKRTANAEKVFNEFVGAVDTSAPAEAADADGTTEDGETTDPTADAASSSVTGCPSVGSGEYVFPLGTTKTQLRAGGNDPGTTEWKSGRYHESVISGYYAADIMVPSGTPVRSMVSGKIQTKSNSFWFGGALQMQILGDDGFIYFYQHMSGAQDSTFKKDDKVNAGDQIGVVGSKREGGGTIHLHIDKSKPDSSGDRGSCAASIAGVGCPGAAEGRFIQELFTDLHNSYEGLPE